MAFKIIETAALGCYIDGRPRDEPLPKGVEAHTAEAVGKHGYHNPGDRWVEYSYADAKAERAHLLQLAAR